MLKRLRVNVRNVPRKQVSEAWYEYFFENYILQICTLILLTCVVELSNETTPQFDHSVDDMVRAAVRESVRALTKT